jgi:hypothetical protein
MSGAALATLIQGRLAGLISDEEFSAAKAHLAAESAGGASPAAPVLNDTSFTYGGECRACTAHRMCMSILKDIVDVAVSPAANQFYSMHRDVAPDLYAPDPAPNSAPTSTHSAAEDACSDDENLELQERLDLVQAKMKSCHDQDVAPVLAFAEEMNRSEVSKAAQRFSYVATSKTPKRRKMTHGGCAR